MRVLKFGFMLTLLVFFVGCSSTQEESGEQFSSETESLTDGASTTEELNSDEAEDLAEAAVLDAEEADQSDPAEETGEDEIAKDEFVGDEGEEPQQTEIAQETPPAPAVEEYQDSETYEGQVVITGIDFKSSENGGTIVIQTNGQAQYTAKENQKNNQYILEIKNARLPERFKKPFNTKEFSGPVGMFQGYQAQGSADAKIVVQLKNATAMSVVQEGNSLLVMPGRADAVAVSTSEPAIVENPDASAANVDTSETEDVVDNDKALTSKTLDDFLTGDAKFYGRKVDIEVKNGDIRDVLNLVSEESGLNLVISPNVKGTVNLKLRRIPWDQALVIMLQTNSLGYVRQGNILRVAPLSEIRAEAEEAKRLLESQKQLEPLKIRIFNVSYAKASELSAQVTNFLSTRGKVKSDDRTNSLVLTDINEVLVKVEKLLKRLDTQTPQVLIEAKIVETREDLTKSFGVEWGVEGLGSYAHNLVTGSVTRSGSVTLGATLSILEQEQKAKVLSSPRIVTLNNEPAKIDQVEQIPIETVTTTATGSSTSTTYRPVALSLMVTPQITAEGGVIMKLNLSREFAIAVAAGEAPPIFSRNASSTVLVQSGDTTVVGGIYQVDKSNEQAGLPVLRKIPLLGDLFGLTTVNDKKNELLIFITPRILNKEKAFGEYAASESKE